MGLAEVSGAGMVVEGIVELSSLVERLQDSACPLLRLLRNCSWPFAVGDILRTPYSAAPLVERPTVLTNAANCLSRGQLRGAISGGLLTSLSRLKVIRRQREILLYFISHSYVF
jgi:hypothetical protein